MYVGFNICIDKKSLFFFSYFEFTMLFYWIYLYEEIVVVLFDEFKRLDISSFVKKILNNEKLFFIDDFMF